MSFTLGALKAKTDRWPDKGDPYGAAVAQWFGDWMKGRYKVQQCFQPWRLADGDAPAEARYKKVALIGDETVEVTGAKFGQRDGIIFLAESTNVPGFVGQKINLEINIRHACDNLDGSFAESIAAALVTIKQDTLVEFGAACTKLLEDRVKEKAVEVQQARAATTPSWGDW